jgi:outer membrane biosynthesis protein TonB
MLEEQQNADRQKLASFFSGFVQNFMGGQGGGAAQMAEGISRGRQATKQEQSPAPAAEKKQAPEQPQKAEAPKAAEPSKKEEPKPAQAAPQAQAQEQPKKKNEKQDNGQQLPAGSDFTKSIDDMFKL